MLKQFKRFIATQKLFLRKEKILLTVSGGIDSVVMCELFYQAGLHFGIAHCNFRLRGSESDGDEKFVKELAEKYNVPFYIHHFETNTYAIENGISIQMAARDLRYAWFDEIIKNECYQYIATAHHQNDQIETFFINLLRGTGIAGLHGILPKQNQIIHPLLFTSREKIEAFAKSNNLNFREDSSNSSTKYLRNAIRLQIIPQFKQLSGDFEKTMIENIEKIRDTEIVFAEMLELKRKELVKIENEQVLINISELQKLNPLKIYLYHFLNPYNFNNETVDSLIVAISEISGKQFFSTTHRLLKDRENLIIIEIKDEPTYCELAYITPETSTISEPLPIDFRLTSESEIIRINPDKNYAYLDYNKLKFPLTLRKWKQGDFFYPIGMKGKKKISDFFTDQKFSIIEKENTWILCSNDDIVWIVGWRIDDRFKLTNNSVKGFIAKLINK
jgi:tRNA(Ile)-lysidine synthase